MCEAPIPKFLGDRLLGFIWVVPIKTKMKQNTVFLVTIFTALLFWQWAYFEFKSHYSGLKESRHEVGSLKRELQRAMVRTSVVQYQFDLFRQQIAKVLPGEMKSSTPELRTQQRGLASIVQKPPEEFLMLAQFETTVEELKRLFEERQYKQVIRKAKAMLELNPVSPSLAVVYFMLAESYYQTNEIDACLSVAQQMIQLFPEEEKTGYVMLRVGLFLKEKNRLEEARNMFGLVSHAFAYDKGLKKQSEKLLGTLGSVE